MKIPDLKNLRDYKTKLEEAASLNSDEEIIKYMSQKEELTGSSWVSFLGFITLITGLFSGFAFYTFLRDDRRMGKIKSVHAQ